MGDDNSPRLVEFGSEVHNQGALFQIRSDDPSRNNWIANAEHILVLRLVEPPRIHAELSSPLPSGAAAEQGEQQQLQPGWEVQHWELVGGSDSNSFVPVLRRAHFASKQAAERHLAAQLATWQGPLRFTCTVRDYLDLVPASLKQSGVGVGVNNSCAVSLQMFQPEGPVQFAPPVRPLRARMYNAIASAKLSLQRTPGPELDMEISDDLLVQTAWLLGLCIATDDANSVDGATELLRQLTAKSAQARRLSREQQWSEPRHLHSMPVAVESWAQAISALSGCPSTVIPATAVDGDSAHAIGAHVLQELLQSYSLHKRKHVPNDLLREDVAVRTALLEGIIDAAPAVLHDGALLVHAKERTLADEYVQLARSLGFLTGAVVQQKPKLHSYSSPVVTNNHVDDDDGPRTWCFTISSSDAVSIAKSESSSLPSSCPSSDVSSSSGLRYHLPLPRVASSDSSCGFGFGFSIAPAGVGSFWGFGVSGPNNKCFLLSDYTVAHNSTILKQMKILHLDGFKSPEEKAAYKALVWKNLLESMQTLCHACDTLKISLDSDENRARSAALLSLSVNDSPLPHKSDIQALWHDTGVQKAVARSSEFHLLDSAPYFLESSERVLQANFEPNTQDILRSRIATTGIIETEFTIDKLLFRMYDVGGQRGERKKVRKGSIRTQ
jgi:hypothetical protein